MADASSECLESVVVVERVLAHSKPVGVVAAVSQFKATWAGSAVEIDAESVHLLLGLAEVVAAVSQFKAALMGSQALVVEATWEESVDQVVADALLLSDVEVLVVLEAELDADKAMSSPQITPTCRTYSPVSV
jgi:hypothetical protein